MGAQLSPREVTDVIVAAVNAGVYHIGDPLPTLDELNERYFGVSAGPRPGREAYAPLIAAGMVEARQGRNGGHFLIAAEPSGASAAFTVIAAELRALEAKVAGLRSTAMYVVEFQNIPSGDFFGESMHPTRVAAEKFAVDMLVRLGESTESAAAAAQVAGWTCANTRGGGYGVRIYGYTLGGKAATR